VRLVLKISLFSHFLCERVFNKCSEQNQLISFLTFHFLLHILDMSSCSESSSSSFTSTSSSSGSRAGTSADRRRPRTREEILQCWNDIIATANPLLQDPVPVLENLRKVAKLIFLFRDLVAYVRGTDEAAPLPDLGRLSLSNARPINSRSRGRGGRGRAGGGRKAIEASDLATTRIEMLRNVEAVISSLEEASHCTDPERFRSLVMHHLGKLFVKR
jgi:hypothetical protein